MSNIRSRSIRSAAAAAVVVALLTIAGLPPSAWASGRPGSAVIPAEAQHPVRCDVRGGDDGEHYLAPDVAAVSDPDFERSVARVKSELPPEELPRSLQTDVPASWGLRASSATGSSGGPTGGGTGGWTPFARTCDPSADPAVTYDSVRSRAQNNRFDKDGVRHYRYELETATDISKPPDAPGFLSTELESTFYATYTEGAWSSPVNLTPLAAMESTWPMLFRLDQDGYLHFVYSKFTWDRDPTRPAGDLGAYIHINENLYYRYRTPEGAWSDPVALTSVTGPWAINSASFYLKGNRVYGTWVYQFDRETLPTQSWTAREMFVDGARDAWNAPAVLKEWTFSTDPGQDSPIWYPYPLLDVSPISGEVTSAFGIRTSGAGAGQSKSNTYSAVRAPDGTWSGPTKLTNAAANNLWNPFEVGYEANGIDAGLVVKNQDDYSSATVEPFENYYYFRRVGAGWLAPLNVTGLPARRNIAFYTRRTDPMGKVHFLFPADHLEWNAGSMMWQRMGSELKYTAISDGAVSDVKTVLGYTAGRMIYAFDSGLDESGSYHTAFSTITSGTSSDVYYSSNAPSAGDFSPPVRLSSDPTQVIDEITLSTTAIGGVLVTWTVSKFSGATPVDGGVLSRTLSGSAWSPVKRVSEVPGSTDIVHVTPTMYPYFSDLSVTRSGEQRCLFETGRYDPGTTTWNTFRKYFVESLNGSWGTPQLISDLDQAGEFPLTVVDPNERVHAVYAVRDPATGQSLTYASMQRGPTPPASTCYFAEGTTRENFQEWICLENPGEVAANVTITYMLGTGENRDQGVVVAAHSRTTVNVNAFIGPGQDVSARVSADQLIVAERPMYFNYNGVYTGGHVAMGTLAPGRVWYFAEGTTRGGFEEWLTLQNPGAQAANVAITYMFGDGSTQQQLLTVGAATRATVSVNAAIGPDKDVSVKVESPDQAIVAERPMYFDYTGKTGGHDAVGSGRLADRWYFAEGTTNAGFDTFLCLQNPNPVAGIATITYILGDSSTSTGTLALPATSRQTLKVNDAVGPDKDVSMVVDSTVPVLAERPMYFDYQGWTGGHDTIGAGGAKNSWFFAEGTTNTGFDEWLSLENPGSADATATLSYVLGDGSVVTRSAAVPAHSRVTIKVNDAIGPDKDVSAAVWSDRGIIAERPMYFDYQGWTGGHDTMGQ